VQALAGDSTDNVPGVPGIGIKTAAQLIVEYGDLERLLFRAGEIKQPKAARGADRERREGADLA
jgi:DNA polymerase-1